MYMEIAIPMCIQYIQKGVLTVMAKGKAETLDDVLELARLRRQSGMLLLEYIQGGRVEEGEVFLQVGQPVYARVGRLVGQDALNWLQSWRNIYFSMGTEVSVKTAATPPANNSNRFAAVPVSLPQQAPLNGGSFRRQVGESIPGIGNGSAPISSFAPGMEWLVPQKRGIAREVLALPLTRGQRYIYFLVDGQRTISDLSRCTGKNIQEIELILNQLQEQGLIAV
jgi:hypothetical protein